MLSSLKWRALWPLGTVLILLVALATFQIDAHRRTVDSLGAVTTMRESLDRAVAQLATRHQSTMRRGRNALDKPGQRVALLAWTSEHYAREMDRLLTEAQTAVGAASRTTRDRAPRANTRLQNDVERIAEQVRGVGQHSLRVAAALDLLLEGASADNAEALSAAATELERADAGMSNALARTTDLIRKASTWQIRDLATAPTRFTWPLVLLIVLSLPLAFWLSVRPLGRISDLAAGVPRRTEAQSREEHDLRGQMQHLRADVDHLARQLEERGLTAERLSQTARRLEHELALLRLYNENLTNSLRSAIVVTDAKGITTGFNRAARKLLGLTNSHVGEPIEGLALFRAFASRSTKARDEVQRALAGNVVRLEGIDYRRDGPGISDGSDPGAAIAGAADTTILLDLTVVPYLDEVGAARGLLWVSDDITDAVRTKNQLLAAEQLAAVGRLSAQVAHEVRNPLSAIGLNAELLAELIPELMAAPTDSTSTDSSGEAASEAQTLVRAIASEVERLSQVTEGYLQLARLPRPDCRAADLNQLVNDLFAMVGEEMRAHAIEVELEFGTPAPRVWVDPGQLRQAMLNIVRNSREAMPEGGFLRVRTSAEADLCVLDFEDTGYGISPEVIPRAFEPFYSTKPEGTGLGLSLTEQIVLDHGGQITLTPGLERGTRVTVTLPSAPPVSPATNGTT